MSRFIPLDKSWMIRVGVLDILGGYKDIRNFLDRENVLSDDLLALKNAVHAWPRKKEIDVGESGTLYRFLKFANWKLALGKTFITHGTLTTRRVCNDATIITWPQEKLLTLDNGTSQWASAAALCGDEERIQNPPYKLALTYEAIIHWRGKRKDDERWEDRYDETIRKQAECFMQMLSGTSIDFKGEQSEDYCFMRALGMISAGEGEGRWPSLRGHETDRIEEMEEGIMKLDKIGSIDSRDHRVVVALAMRGKIRKKPYTVLHPEAVNKSWPQFWKFLESVS